MRKERTAPESEASDADARHAPTRRVHARAVQRQVHLVPDVARPDLDRLFVLAELDVLEARHGDLHARRGREALVGSMPSTLDGERSLGRANNLELS